ncbi:MAG: DUF2017 domain-containing protein [Longispora sp.]|nr:DUF2017 domain-containing protein [Longispora sp. (in: high G+C Gram-positive bacteria)]
MTFRRKKGKIVANFRPEEIIAIRTILTEVTDLIDDGDRSDPVIGRLFPDIYRDDPVESAELRQYTEDDLKKTKIESVGIVLDTLAEHTTLTYEQADAWLRALNDARLALGIRLGIHDDFDLETEYHKAAGSRATYISLYSYLSYLQDTLIEPLS